MKKTTAIGSLPFTDLKEAIEFSLSHDLPFVPELTKLNEQMISRNQDTLLKICQSLTNHRIKNQIIGPATFEHLTKSGMIEYQEYFKKSLNEHKNLKQKFNLEIYLQIDEPVLLTSNNYKLQYQNLLEDIKQSGLNPIFHTCQKLTTDYTFPNWEKPYLALDVLLNPQYINHPLLLVEGYDPRITGHKGNSEYISYTCGFGLLEKAEVYKIKDLLK